MMLRRGTGLMAGPPTSRPRPALVTTPTPKPPLSTTSPARCGAAHVGRQVGAVRRIRVVAGILDDGGMGQAGALDTPSMTANA
jgi:hypothetical protein